MTIPAFATHMCIGSPYAWSVMSATIALEYGFVTSAASDWTFMQVTAPVSIVFAFQGLMAALFGKWQMRVGTKTAMLVAATCFGGGTLLGAAGVATHQLWMLYAGYGVLAGTGVGLAYTPPVQALLEWFPDRKAMASGLTIAGFGSGALLAAPLFTKLCASFATLPTYLGTRDAVATITQDGKLFSEVEGTLREVVVATAADLVKLAHTLPEGVYLMGSGNTGAAQALAVMGVGYFGVMSAAALAMKRPAPGYVPPGFVPPVASPNAPSALQNVHVDTVMRTPQFQQLGVMFFCVACGGMGLFSVAKPMMNEIFSSTLPGLVTAAFAGNYVLALSAGNLGGRLGWAALSDKIGRRATFQMFTFGSIPLFLSVPYLVRSVVESGSSVGLYGFIGATVCAVTIMGGTYAILPAYGADLFGTKYVGANHGRMLLASSGAALAGPSLLMWLRAHAEAAALRDLLAQVHPARFQQVFGVGTDHFDALVQSKTITIPKLLELAPVGTADPSPYIYDSTMYAMAGLMTVAAISHHLIKPVNPKYFEKLPVPPAEPKA